MSKFNVRDIVSKKGKEKLVMVTAYDHITAVVAKESNADLILVGDSGGMVVMGYDTTRNVTIEDMLFMAKSVSRSNDYTFKVIDMPFLSYGVSERESILNAGRLIKEGGGDAVKLEGGSEIKNIIKRLVDLGIPVVGHLGLTPQSTPFFKGFGPVGKNDLEVEKILEDAKQLEDAGAFLIVLENVISEVAELVTQSVKIPTIGIGSGRMCDGQVLVMHDILGMYDKFMPKFAKKYRYLLNEMKSGVSEYVLDVRKNKFPFDENISFASREFKDELAKYKGD